ncbi:MAG: hypothetical protein QM784_03640 [Polyangiaceae bacterium]
MVVLNPPAFLEDWRDQLRHELSRAGIVDPDDGSQDEGLPIEHRYFDITAHWIEPRRRRVHEARGFRVPNALKRAYYALRHKISEGGDLRPHQSRWTQQGFKRDDLFNDWGIHHLHLGRRLRDDGLVERTAPVLFGVFRPDDAFILSLEDHGSAHPLLWSDARHLQVIASNWPHLLRPFATEETDAHGLRASPREIQRARREGIPLTFMLDNDVAYNPPGGGVHPSGHGNRAVAVAEQFRNRVAEAQAAAVANFEPLVETARALGLTWNGELTLRLHVADALWANVEGTSWYWLLEPAIPVRLEEWRPRTAKLDAAPRATSSRRSR